MSGPSPRGSRLNLPLHPQKPWPGQIYWGEGPAIMRDLVSLSTLKKGNSLSESRRDAKIGKCYRSFLFERRLKNEAGGAHRRVVLGNSSSAASQRGPRGERFGHSLEKRCTAFKERRKCPKGRNEGPPTEERPEKGKTEGGRKAKYPPGESN